MASILRLFPWRRRVAPCEQTEPGVANSALAPESNGDAYYLAIGGGVAEHNWNHIRTVLQDQGFRCQLTDHSEDMGMISIQGPK
ncbi:sarcosine dehydrogenase, mitochondrial, partial [Lates japonicus]